MTQTHNQDQVRLLALALPVGGRSTHQLCPVCGGGTSRERSLVVSRSDSALFYKCYRNKCGWHGVISSVPTDREVSNRVKRERPPDTYNGQTRILVEEDIAFLQDKFELSREMIVQNRVKRNLDNGKCAFPIIALDGREIGILDRDFRPGVTKAKVFWFSYKVPKLHFPRELNEKYTRRIFIVEDILSAMKINQLGRVAVCAILGTSISDDTMKYLSSITDSITLMLDPDAIQTANRYRKRYNLLFKQPIGVVQLKEDPKDTPFEELQEKIF